MKNEMFFCRLDDSSRCSYHGVHFFNSPIENGARASLGVSPGISVSRDNLAMVEDNQPTPPTYLHHVSVFELQIEGLTPVHGRISRWT